MSWDFFCSNVVRRKIAANIIFYKKYASLVRRGTTLATTFNLLYFIFLQSWAGEYAAAFIDVLTSPAVGVDPSSIHAIGASLGAHAAAAAGARIAEGGRKIGRLTGLDPSGPLHYSVPRDLRLDEGDAQFVDVIHTAGKVRKIDIDP